jgi:hypothetical protein
LAVLDEADRIWNRACDPFARHTAPGDRALQALLRVHGQVMNGGLVSALEYNAPEEIQEAIGGFRYFDLDVPARSLAMAFEIAFDGGGIAERGDHLDALGGEVHERLEQLEDEYYAAVPRDAVLEAAFRTRLSEAHEDFAPA